MTMVIAFPDIHLYIPLQPTAIEPDIMTPITDYIVFYGVRPSRLRNVTIQDSSASSYNISGLTKGGNFTVGVAAINSAGQSEINFASSNIGRFGSQLKCLFLSVVNRIGLCAPVSQLFQVYI